MGENSNADVENALLNHSDSKVPILNGNGHIQNGKAHLPLKKVKNEEEEEFVPPDGGTRSWLVMLGSFFCNGCVFGLINSYSVIYTEIRQNLQAMNDTDASSKAALVGSLTMGTTFMMSPVAGVLTDLIGLRLTTFIGGCLASGGLFISSFFPTTVEVLYFTYGIMFGLGAALAYTPSLAILGHYFKKYLGVVNGIVTAGSSAFTISLPYFIDYILKALGLKWTFRILSFIACGLIGSAALFKPAYKRTGPKKNCKTAFNLSIWTNKKYVIWALCVGFCLSGYFVPYVHMLKFVEDNYSEEYDGKLPVICIGIASGVGRLIFGYLGDHPKVNRIFLQQIAFFSIGFATVLLPSTCGMFYLLLLATLVMGIFDGCFITLIGPIAFEICGQSGATQAIGFLLGMCSIPLTIGPYIAGLLYDHMGSYHLAFRLSGVPPMIGAFLLFFVWWIKPSKPVYVPTDQQKEDSPLSIEKMKEPKDWRGK